ncbi:xanthine dehydrogenase small subunit [Rathayibacter soli]|uniref:xanthine dehydrogenase small subunit n=1 Tax=Rathayibacter soli TaxID=3144168 RepID=UPI0027E423AD|nr:FAD binding domain-containing protein [Glaciibacter superstes]
MNEQSRPVSEINAAHTATTKWPGVIVNGQQRPLGEVASHTTALDWLRTRGLTGSKEGCAEGECGACAVLVAGPDGHGGTAWNSVNSCLIPVAALDGQEIVTSEGLGSPEHLNPVQAEMASNGSSQCGYCTSGFACSMAAEFYRRGRSDDAAHEGGASQISHEHHEHGPNGFDLHALGGNLCRCTGYRPIRDAAYALGDPDPADALALRRDRPAPAAVATDLTASDGRFVRPSTLIEALSLLAENPGAKVLAGSTDWGVEVNLRGSRNALVIAIDRLPELRTFDTVTENVGTGSTSTGGFVEIGAALTLSEVERDLDGRIPLLAELFPQFASRLIRNRATIGGNLGTGSPIGDTPPALLALGARVVLASLDGEREVPIDEYFTGYRTTVRESHELIRAIRIPLPTAPIVAFHKIAKRRFDDISSVALAFALEVDAGIVTGAMIGLGGVAATPLRARATEAALIGRAWNEDTIAAASAVLGAEGTPMEDHRASAAYRRIMLSQALPKLYVQTGDGQASESQEVSV